MSSGHRFGDILEYTWGQLLAFSEADSRVRRARSVELFRLLLVSGSRDEKSVQAWLDDYTKD